MEAAEYIFVDCNALGLTGSFTERLSEPFMIVDYDLSTRGYGRYRFIFREVPATCEIFFDFLCQKNWQIDAPTANALYVGIFTDNGNFCYSQTTARTFFLASHLVLQGANPSWNDVQLTQNEPRGKIQLLQRVFHDDAICVGMVTQQDHAETSTNSEDMSGFVNFARSMAGCKSRWRISARWGHVHQSAVKVSGIESVFACGELAGRWGMR